MKILILEQDAKLPEGHLITYWLERMEKEGHEIKYVFNAYNEGQKIAKMINWPDVLAFSSTFVYINSIFQLTQLIAKHRKEELSVFIDNSEVSDNIEKLVEIAADSYNVKKDLWYLDEEKADDFAFSLQKLKIFTLSRDNHHEPITILDERIARQSKRISDLKQYMDSRQ